MANQTTQHFHGMSLSNSKQWAVDTGDPGGDPPENYAEGKLRDYVYVTFEKKRNFTSQGQNRGGLQCLEKR